MSDLFAFGLGYCARALASRLRSSGWTIRGTATSAESAMRLRSLGYDAHVFHTAQSSPELGSAFAAMTHALVSVPPDDDGDVMLRCFADALAEAPRLRWVGYLSTIGVYGDRGGAWVDEDTEPRPVSARSKRRLLAETEWLRLGARSGKRVQVFRLAGIYGPGRSVVDSLRAGTARRIVKEGQVFNRIHVEDVAGTLEAAITRSGSHSIYNVTDDEPAPPQDVVAHTARLLGVPVPPDLPIEKAQLSGMSLSFYAASKRVRNARIKEDLGVRLLYPTFREGLAAIIGK